MKAPLTAERVQEAIEREFNPTGLDAPRLKQDEARWLARRATEAVMRLQQEDSTSTDGGVV